LIELYDHAEDDDEDFFEEVEVFESEQPERKKGKKIMVDLGKSDPEENLVIYSEEHYSNFELDEMATEILRAQARSIDPETGKPRGIAGEDPVLFEEHLYSRKRREIYNQNGVPDPSINEGMFWRTHPQGRKVNSNDQRKKHGASFYR
jgi:hypothetical protein